MTLPGDMFIAFIGDRRGLRALNVAVPGDLFIGLIWCQRRAVIFKCDTPGDLFIGFIWCRRRAVNSFRVVSKESCDLKMRHSLVTCSLVSLVIDEDCVL